MSRSARGAAKRRRARAEPRRARNRATRTDDAHDGGPGVVLGRRYRLLRVREVADRLGVSNATVHGLCERGELPYVWVVTSMRIRPDDLEAFIAARITIPVKRRPHRRKATE